MLALAAALLAIGWTTKGWYEDSEQLAADKAVERAEKAISEKLEEKLVSLKANERIIVQERLKIVDRPVYSNVCLDQDAVNLINKSKGGISE